jgi:hypothetical protein
MIKDKLLAVLDSSNGERGIQKFLKKNPRIVLWSFVKIGGHSKFVIAEFPFGSHYRADFVIPVSHSGVWEVHFVELEPPSDKVITRSGRPTKAFSGAISQIHDWKDYVDQNRTSVQRDLSEWCVKKDILGLHSNKRPPSNYSGNYLKDPESFVRFEYHIVIGRRKNVTNEIRRKINQFNSNDCDVCTFDAFADIAENLDAAAAKKPGVYLARRAEDHI